MPQIIVVKPTVFADRLLRVLDDLTISTPLRAHQIRISLLAIIHLLNWLKTGQDSSKLPIFGGLTLSLVALNSVSFTLSLFLRHGYHS